MEPKYYISVEEYDQLMKPYYNSSRFQLLHYKTDLEIEHFKKQLTPKQRRSFDNILNSLAEEHKDSVLHCINLVEQTYTINK